MSLCAIISTDKQAREASIAIAEIKAALSSEQVLGAIVEGLPHEVVDGVRTSLLTERRELDSILEAYVRAKSGDITLLKEQAGNDPGAVLIVARISKGLSQKELGRKLGLREQAVQRYEAERYRTISLAGYQKFASVLDVDWRFDSSSSAASGWAFARDITPDEARKVLKHARANGWFAKANSSDESGLSQLKRDVAEHVVKYGAPSLLRTGLNVHDHSEDWVLLSWKAQVTRRAEEVIKQHKLSYSPLEVSWLLDLVRLSELDDGPVRAIDILKAHGIVLIVEPHISGMRVDGAAFLVGRVPVIGMTLLRDRLDNFWFTLLHEVAHIVLHYRTGLIAGFFDDFGSPAVGEFEEEANAFAENLLIPEDQWRRSPARIAKTAAPVEALARKLGISPAIIFGRIRMERNNYALFSDKIGNGVLRKQLLGKNREVTEWPKQNK